jgi:hypothetical protein
VLDWAVEAVETAPLALPTSGPRRANPKHGGGRTCRSVASVDKQVHLREPDVSQGRGVEGVDDLIKAGADARHLTLGYAGATQAATRSSTARVETPWT